MARAEARPRLDHSKGCAGIRQGRRGDRRRSPMLNTLDRQAMAPRWPDVPRLLRRAFAANAPLALIGLGSMALLIAALIGLLADPTVITDAPAWMKPLKFAVSTAVYAF